MGLTSSLHIGGTALAASQLAMQVTGNNIANVSTPGYHRQRVSLAAMTPAQRLGGVLVGRGVSIDDIKRAIDPALQIRLRNSLSNEQEAAISANVLTQIESVLSELSGNDLSSELSAFFNAFSELANNPSATANRSTVVEAGGALSSFIQRVHGDLTSLRRQIDDQLSVNVTRADALLDEIAQINVAISSAELGANQDGSLRDQRDVLLDELAGMMEITVIERDSGVVDVLVGSQPVVSGSRSRGLEVEFVSDGTSVEARVQTRLDTERLKIQSGSIGGLLDERDGSVQGVIDELNDLTASLIFEVNRAHSSGRPDSRLTDVTALRAIALADQALALNDPANTSLSGLPFSARNGAFDVVLTDANGNQTTTTIQIDLDGIDNTGAAGFVDDTSLSDIAASLDAISGLNAQITPDGRLRMFTDAGFDVSFANDTSGTLAVLGVNAYFTGETAANIEVNAELQSDPLRLAVGLSEGSNETALSVAALRDASLDTLAGDSLSGRWQKTVERNGVRTSGAITRAEAAATVRASLEAQNAAVSAVSLDDESINLITYQQQYAGAARFISIVNEMTDILLSLV